MNDVSRSFRGNSNAARDIAHHLHPYTNFKKHEEQGPLTIVRGRGIYVMDDDGKEYLDFLTGLATVSLGHAHPEVADALADQARTLLHVSNLYLNDVQPQLADRIDALLFAIPPFYLYLRGFGGL